MPPRVSPTFICPDCGDTVVRTVYNQERCPLCADVHRKARILANYHKRKKSHKGKDERLKEYDGKHHGKPESVYSSMCVIHIKREVGRCKGCNEPRNLINGYCELCRANCANERQCMNPRSIRAPRS